jgi:acetyltransferase-like isoleucine patch superfamily enzyme
LRREHRPYFVKRAKFEVDRLYAKHFLHPHFDAVGIGTTFVNPWQVKVFGPSIEIGKYANVVAAPNSEVSLTVWRQPDGKGRIRVGDYALIGPGVRISSTHEIIIEENAMIASNAYLMDCDWHDIYDRVYATGKSAPIRLEQNVWIGDSSIVCKGVTIGKNSVVGAGSVVVRDVPPNTVVAGNPAQEVKKIDPNGTFVTRKQLLADPEPYIGSLMNFEREVLRRETVSSWLRYLLLPNRQD